MASQTETTVLRMQEMLGVQDMNDFVFEDSVEGDLLM